MSKAAQELQRQLDDLCPLGHPKEPHLWKRVGNTYEYRCTRCGKQQTGQSYSDPNRIEPTIVCMGRDGRPRKHDWQRGYVQGAHKCVHCGQVASDQWLALHEPYGTTAISSRIPQSTAISRVHYQGTVAPEEKRERWEQLSRMLASGLITQEQAHRLVESDRDLGPIVNTPTRPEDLVPTKPKPKDRSNRALSKVGTGGSRGKA